MDVTELLRYTVGTVIFGLYNIPEYYFTITDEKQLIFHTKMFLEHFFYNTYFFLLKLKKFVFNIIDILFLYEKLLHLIN